MVCVVAVEISRSCYWDEGRAFEQESWRVQNGSAPRVLVQPIVDMSRPNSGEVRAAAYVPFLLLATSLTLLSAQT